MIALYAVLIAPNLLAWGWALAAFHGSAVLLGTAGLAYGFGLRHAMDADHIAAIDNVIRKLTQQGQRPIAAGLFFALGHSTLVVAGAVAIALSADGLHDRWPGLAAAGDLLGTALSALFLCAIGAINAGVFAGVYRLYRRVRRGEPVAAADLDVLLARRGVLSVLFRALFRLISRSWQMFPLGLLFALGFDTASEIGVLGISAAQAMGGLSIGSILVFPVLFAAGMTLVDGLDGVLMARAYGWAFVSPLRKLHYNLAITGVSVVVALGVGALEALAVAVRHLGLTGETGVAIAVAADKIGMIGYAAFGTLAACWLAGLLLAAAARPR